MTGSLSPAMRAEAQLVGAAVVSELEELRSTLNGLTVAPGAHGLLGWLGVEIARRIDVAKKRAGIDDVPEVAVTMMPREQQAHPDPHGVVETGDELLADEIERQR